MSEGRVQASMRTPRHAAAERAAREPAANVTRQPGAAAHADPRGALETLIQRSPRAAAEQRQRHAIFGLAVQREAAPIEEELQLKAQPEATSAAAPSRGGAQGVTQRVAVFGDVVDLEGADGTIHYHHLFDDADRTSLHVTFADKRAFAARAWAMRSGYTPTGRDTGNWAPLAVNLGAPPAWAAALAGTRLPEARNGAEAAFHANASVKALLAAAYPVAAPTAADFPALKTTKK